ncbi:hypothetical protein BH10PAT2_BH10PAT2_2650 [soil metagenome]
MIVNTFLHTYFLFIDQSFLLNIKNVTYKILRKRRVAMRKDTP